MIESLSALLTGASITWQVLAWMGHDPSRPTGHGAAFLAFDIGTMMPLAHFHERAEALCREIHASPKAPGAERIYLPGEMEWDRRDRASPPGFPCRAMSCRRSGDWPATWGFLPRRSEKPLSA